jgi:putative ABC transport system ATP-binding protein
MSYIIAESLEKTFGNGGAAVNAVSGISFNIAPGEFVGVMGESGAGKSTLLGMLGAMNAPSAGRLRVDGIDVYGLKQEQRADFRREYLGFVFQSFHLVAYLTVIENVMLPLTVTRRAAKEKRAMALAALSQVGLAEKADRLPGEISGGEKERVAVARAIVNEPPVLLADEPTGNLDSRTAEEVLNLVIRLHADANLTVAMVTHDPVVAACAGRVVILHDGLVVYDQLSPSRGGPEIPHVRSVAIAAADAG